jgi:hypothetical protein
MNSIESPMPLNNGATFQTEVGPRLINCPSDISINKTGIALIRNKTVYGIK